MKAILHIGQQKTGSTSLQYVLEVNRKKLSSNNILYPKSLGHNKQVSLQRDWSILQNPDSSLSIEFKKELKAQDWDYVIFSEENLFVCKPFIKEAVRDFLHRHFDEIIIVVYLRRQELHIPSHYQQAVKGKVHLTTDEWINRMMKIKNNYYLYDKVIDTWSGLMPKAEIIIKPFYNLQGNELYFDFLKIVDIHNFDDYNFEVPLLNESIDKKSIELFRIINKLKFKKELNISEKTRVDLRNFLIKNSSKEKLLLSQRQIELIFSETNESNKRLVSKYKLSESHNSYFTEKLSLKKQTIKEEEEEEEALQLVNLLMQYYLKAEINK